jgi:hypothetical protein
VNVSILGDVGGLQAKALVNYVRHREQSQHDNFFPIQTVRVICTDWLRVPEETAPPSYAPTPFPTMTPTTLKEEYEMEGVVSGYKEESDSNTGPFVHHTCVRLRGGTILDFPQVGYGNRAKTALGWTGVPTTRTQCLGACKDQAKCSGAEYYPYYRECWLYTDLDGVDPMFNSHPVQATEDMCWTGYLKEEWRIPYRAAFTGEAERPERFVPVPKAVDTRPIVDEHNTAIVPVPVQTQPTEVHVEQEPLAVSRSSDEVTGATLEEPATGQSQVIQLHLTQ